jgi:hypothetical protein
MSQFIKFNQDDTIISTEKVTTGYFTGGLGTLYGANLTTASLSATNKKYYYNLQYSSADQLSVSYGHKGGSGSSNVTSVKGETEAIYKAFATQLLGTDLVADGFKINGSVTDHDCHFIVAEQALAGDRINRKNWTIQLSGSLGPSKTGLWLTDDSNTLSAIDTPAGPRYNIVSGSLGTVAVPATTTRYGFFYPNAGIWVLSTATLSSSIGNLERDETIAVATDNALKLVTAMGVAVGGTGNATQAHSIRSETDQVTTSYFCRSKARDHNFSNNPTFKSGSDGRYAQKSFEGNPQTFITTVGLYNNRQELVAVGKLSSPVQKNFNKEVVFKTELVY